MLYFLIVDESSDCRSRPAIVLLNRARIPPSSCTSFWPFVQDKKQKIQRVENIIGLIGCVEKQMSPLYSVIEKQEKRRKIRTEYVDN
uniref:DUF4371 domain-containing protein n=1 Tax=Romanomermis culicivorax TaxID=13658 RepID=A0A915IXS2_ROMCU